MDKYTDLVTVSKPVIYISIEEIINTHLVSGSRRGLGPRSWIRHPFIGRSLVPAGLAIACAHVSVFKPNKSLP